MAGFFLYERGLELAVQRCSLFVIELVVIREPIIDLDELDDLAFWQIGRLIQQETPVPNVSLDRMHRNKLSIALGRLEHPGPGPGSAPQLGALGLPVASRAQALAERLRRPRNGRAGRKIFEGDTPRYTIAVFVDHHVPGGGVAASIAADLARQLAR